MNLLNEQHLHHLFEEGVASHQAGRLGDAEAKYRQVLQAAPNHAEALHLLGVLAAQVGRPDAAVGLIEKSIAIAPENTEARFNLANALSAQGRFAEAIAHYQQALAQQPSFIEAMIGLGHARQAAGDRNGALDIWQQALLKAPNNPPLLFEVATAKYESGDLTQAMVLLERASRQPGAPPEVFNSLGIMLGEAGRNAESVEMLRKALAMGGDNPEVLSNLGDALRRVGLEKEAEQRLSAALRLRPDWPVALGNLANLRMQRGDLDEAVETYQRALAAAPADAGLWNNLGIALRKKLDIAGAIEAHRRAIVRQPDLADAHYALAWSLLLTGQFDQGWKEFEWRLRLKHRLLNQENSSRWDGKPALGKTVLVYAEQGFGDTIQFLRYLPMVPERVGRLIVAVQPELRRLVQDFQTVPFEGPKPSYDLSIPLMSLAGIFGLVGMDKPYIPAAPAAQNKTPQVGVIWAGRPTHTDDRNRSIPVGQLELLKDVSVQFHSLHNEIAGPSWMIDHRSSLTDFSAARDLIASLDLVIAVDTAIAHLAGAMGKPVWILLPFSPDWRWMLNREDSPWYPSAKLFRQSKRGDWTTVVSRVAEELKRLAQAPRPASD